MTPPLSLYSHDEKLTREILCTIPDVGYLLITLTPRHTPFYYYRTVLTRRTGIPIPIYAHLLSRLLAKIRPFTPGFSSNRFFIHNSDEISIILPYLGNLAHISGDFRIFERTRSKITFPGTD